MNEWIITSSALILAVLALRALLKGRISLRLQYALWALVLVRLLVPVQFFTSEMSVAEATREVDLSGPVRRIYTAARSEDFQADYEAAYRQIEAEYAAQDRPAVPDAIDKEAYNRVTQSRELDLKQLLYGVWFVGMGILALALVGCNLHFMAKLRRSRRPVEEPGCLLDVYESAAVPTPCLVGLFRPAIYLTTDAAGTEAVRRHVLAHEMTHYRHLDHVWAVLRSVCLVLHWYNPLVWIAFRRSREDAELACDEGALARLGEEHRAEYGRTLIQLTCRGGIGTSLIAATTMTGSARTIAQRLKLLMKRPKTTVLALIAVIVAGIMAVGCTFSAAPGATAPEASAETTEPTGHEPNPDMSNKDQDLPIPDFTEPGIDTILTDGILTYPGTQWNQTPEEVKAALNLNEADCTTTYVESQKATNHAIHIFEARNQVFCRIPVTVRFEFRSFTREHHLGLTSVQVLVENADALYPIMQVLEVVLGHPDFMTSGVLSEAWESDTWLSEIAGADYWPACQVELDWEDAPASKLMVLGPGTGEENQVQFTSDLAQLLQMKSLWQAGHEPDPDMSNKSEELPIPDFPELTESDTVAYFSALLNPQLYRSEADWYPRALSSFYDDPTQIDLFQLFYSGIPGADNTLSESEEQYLYQQPGFYPELDTVRIPAAEMDRVLTRYFGITLQETAGIGLENFVYIAAEDCYYHCHSDSNLRFWEVTVVEEVGNGIWRVWYESNPDYGAGEYSGVITLRLVDYRWQVRSNVPTAGMLTPTQIDQVNAAFEPLIPVDGPDGMGINPVTCFFSSYYDDVRELDLQAFLRYCPVGQDATEAEFQLLKQEANFAHRNCETLEDMPVPLHCYRAEDVDALLLEYAGIRHDDLEDANQGSTSLYYLKETDSYYNDTSDAGFETFTCIGGIIYDDYVMLYSDRATLILREVDGKYYIQAHQIIK